MLGTIPGFHDQAIIEAIICNKTLKQGEIPDSRVCRECLFV